MDAPDPRDGLPRLRDESDLEQTPRRIPGIAPAWIAVLLLAAALRLWGLGQNGYGNPYYAAASRSMITSASNFFFASFDPAGYVSVDKPPLALWVQAASAWLFGFSGLSLLVPQALMGVAAVGLTGWLVRRTGGETAGLIAALVLALMPISVAVDRDNMPDSLLVLLLLLAAGALLRATRSDRFLWLIVSLTLVALGFNTKMLAAFVVLPTFYLVYFLGAPIDAGRRVRNLAAATCFLFAVSLSWSAIVDLTPASSRPYMGGSTRNSAIELALGYNGLGRVFGGMGNIGPPPGGMRGGPPGTGVTLKAVGNPSDAKAITPPGDGDGPPPFPLDPAMMPDDMPFPPPGDMLFPPPGGMPGFGGGPPGFGGGPPGFGGGPPGFGGGPPGFGGMPGPFRLLQREMAGQFAWLLPLALIGMIPASRGAGWRRPMGEQAQALLLWSGWFLSYAVIFSFSRGITHSYYTILLGLPLAALVGLGVRSMMVESAEAGGGWRGWLLPMAIVLTASWQYLLLLSYPTWMLRLAPVLAVAAALAVVGSIATRVFRTGSQWGRGPAPAFVLLCAGLAALLAVPSVWALSAVLAKGIGMMPAADPSLLLSGREEGGPGMGPPGMGFGPPGMEQAGQTKLIDFLKANRRQERFLLAAPMAPMAAPIIIESGAPVMAIGGFLGADPILTEDQFAAMVRAGEIRFALSMPFGPGGPMGGPGGPMGGPGGPMGGPGGPMGGNSPINKWIREHGKQVDASYWQDEPQARQEENAGGDGPPGFPPFMRRRMRPSIYDLRPERGLIKPVESEKGGASP